MNAAHLAEHLLQYTDPGSAPATITDGEFISKPDVQIQSHMCLILID